MKIKKRMLIGLIREALTQADKDALIDADSASLRTKAYRKLCLTYHPDKGGETSDFQELNNLFAALENGSYKPAQKAEKISLQKAEKKSFLIIFQVLNQLQTRYLMLQMTENY